MTLKKLVAAGLSLVIGVQVIAMLIPDRRLVLVMVGLAVAVTLLALRWFLVRGSTDDAAMEGASSRAVAAALSAHSKRATCAR